MDQNVRRGQRDTVGVGGGGGNWRRRRELLRWASAVCSWCGFNLSDAADCL